MIETTAKYYEVIVTAQVRVAEGTDHKMTFGGDLRVVGKKFGFTLAMTDEDCCLVLPTDPMVNVVEIVDLLDVRAYPTFDEETT